MNATDFSRGAPEAGERVVLSAVAGPAGPASSSEQRYETCDACGAPVAAEQRYCVVCGSKRRNASDPAARFLAGASAAARVERSRAAAGRTAARRRTPSLAAALLVAIVPAAVAVGVLAGRSSSSGDAKLISELAALQPRSPEATTTAAPSTASSNASSTTASTVPRTLGTSTPRAHHAAKAKSHASTTTATANASRSAAAAGQLSATPTQQQLTQGAAVVRKVQQSSGSSYVNSQRNLPNVVAVP